MGRESGLADSSPARGDGDGRAPAGVGLEVLGVRGVRGRVGVIELEGGGDGVQVVGRESIASSTFLFVEW